MIEYKVVVINDNNLTDQEIYDLINNGNAPLVIDARTGEIKKLLPQIIAEQQYARDKTETLPRRSNKPDAIKI